MCCKFIFLKPFEKLFGKKKDFISYNGVILNHNLIKLILGGKSKTNKTSLFITAFYLKLIERT